MVLCYSLTKERLRPSRENQDEQIDLNRRRRTDVRMKKHPELWPYVPSDRYGTVSNKQVNCSSGPTWNLANDKSLRHNGQTSTNTGKQNCRQSNEKTRNQQARTNAQPATRFNRQQRSTCLPSVPIARRPISTDTDLTDKPVARAFSPLKRTISSKASLRCVPPEVSPVKNLSITPQKYIERQQQQKMNDGRCPDDSGVEIDSSLVDVLDGLKESNEDQQEELGENEEEDDMKLERARRELEDLAQREAEDRKKRQLIVETILSKFSSNS